MCSPFLARLRVLQTEFQEEDPEPVPESVQGPLRFLIRFTLHTLPAEVLEYLRFPNPVALFLTVFVEMPLRGLYLPFATRGFSAVRHWQNGAASAPHGLSCRPEAPVD